MSDYSKNWSMDINFLNNLNRLIQTYMDADVGDNLELMYKMIKNIEIIASPKLNITDSNTTKEHDTIKWIRNNLNKIFVLDKYTGKVRGMHEENYIILRTALDETLRSLLHKLEKEEIYTHKTLDPNKALGRY